MIAAQPSRILPSAQPAAPGPAPDPRLHVVLFSGGRGAHSICEAMLRYPRIALTILINAYDDGHSTGRIRRFIPGMLGPSDVRKNLDRLMPTGECYRALRFVCDYRLPESICSRDGQFSCSTLLRRGKSSSETPTNMVVLPSRRKPPLEPMTVNLNPALMSSSVTLFLSRLWMTVTTSFIPLVYRPGTKRNFSPESRRGGDQPMSVTTPSSRPISKSVDF